MKKLVESLRTRLFGPIRNREEARDFLLKEMPKDSVCAEIGVYKGDFSDRVLAVVKPRLYHLIDPWNFDPAPEYKDSLYGGERGASQARMDAIHDGVVKRFEAPIAAGVVRVHRAASREAAAAFPDGYFDWIYIDGNHQYEFVKDDLECYFPKVKVGGYIAGDDYGEGGWWKGGVKKAVDEFAASGRVENLQLRKRQFWFKRR